MDSLEATLRFNLRTGASLFGFGAGLYQVEYSFTSYQLGPPAWLVAFLGSIAMVQLFASFRFAVGPPRYADTFSIVVFSLSAAGDLFGIWTLSGGDMGFVMRWFERGLAFELLSELTVVLAVTATIVGRRRPQKNDPRQLDAV